MKNGMGRAGLIYYQVVSVALLLVMTGFSIAGLWGLVGVAVPSFTIEAFAFRQVRTRADYIRENYNKKSGLYYRNASGDGDGVSIDDVTELWRAAHDEALGNERRSAGRTLVLAVIAVAVCLPLYRAHHRVVQQALAHAEKPEG